MVGENEQRIQFTSNRWLVGMELELQVKDNSIVPIATSQQNYGSQYFHQPDVLNQSFPDIPMNLDIHNTIPAQSEFEVYDQVGPQNTLLAHKPFPLDIGVHNNHIVVGMTS